MKKDSQKALKNPAKRAFTLAEVLITLVIIGVIAALTVPTLIQNTQKQEYVTGLKKAYSTLSNAANMAIAENGSPKCSDGGWACTSAEIYEKFKKHMNTARACGESGCMEQVYNCLNGRVMGTWNEHRPLNKLVSADGMQIAFTDWGLAGADYQSCTSSYPGGSSNICARIMADVNGAKKPNILGRDLFEFDLTENGIIPAGCASSGSCAGTEGWSCACKVLTEGAMNY